MRLLSTAVVVDGAPTQACMQPIMDTIFKQVLLCTYSIDSSCELPPTVVAPGTPLARIPFFKIVQVLTKVRQHSSRP